jgi:hypothetical protein
MVGGEAAAQFNDPSHPVRRLCGELGQLFKVALASIADNFQLYQCFTYFCMQYAKICC